MNAVSFREGSRLVGAARWSAIATGAFICMALSSLLSLLGLAIGTSVGDGTAEGGFVAWTVLAQLASLALGAAVAGFLARPEHRMGGAAAGFMTWAVVLVLGSVLQWAGPFVRTGTGAVWGAFLAALLGLGVGVLAGALGGGMAARRVASVPPKGPTHLSETNVRTV